MSDKDSRTRGHHFEISDRTLTEVVDLARLDPDSPKVAEQKTHLGKILKHFAVLSEVVVDEVDPAVMINPTPLPLRMDEAGVCLTKDEALRNSKLTAGDFFRSPSILSGDDQGH
jgi:aspartyl/glutamyl-tRNA(Asn/Gln) amidotransferase C subunit